jgi:hypothetical protein
MHDEALLSIIGIFKAEPGQLTKVAVNVDSLHLVY